MTDHSIGAFVEVGRSRGNPFNLIARDCPGVFVKLHDELERQVMSAGHRPIVAAHPQQGRLPQPHPHQCPRSGLVGQVAAPAKMDHLAGQLPKGVVAPIPGLQLGVVEQQGQRVG